MSLHERGGSPESTDHQGRMEPSNQDEADHEANPPPTIGLRPRRQSSGGVSKCAKVVIIASAVVVGVGVLGDLSSSTAQQPAAEMSTTSSADVCHNTKPPLSLPQCSIDEAPTQPTEQTFICVSTTQSTGGGGGGDTQTTCPTDKNRE